MPNRYRSRYSHAFSKLQTKALTLDEFPQPPRPKEPEPTLSWLIAHNKPLKIECIDCGRKRLLSPLEAVASYGGMVRFSELRQIIWGRCGANPCKALIGPTLEDYKRTK